MINFHFLESLSHKHDEFGKRMAPKSKAGKKIYDFLGYFSLRERAVFYILFIIFIVSFGMIVKQLNDAVTTSVPVHGGTFKEGVVGIPRFANPVLATSDVDKDLSSLVYSGLMRVGPLNGGGGALIPDLAEKYDVSADGLTYTFIIKRNAVFQDGSRVTSADIAYTIGQVKNPIFKSPRALAWNGVSVETPDDRTVVFRLKSPYALFLENTTIGILPKHIWKKVNDDTFPYTDLNLTGHGSGPFRVVSISKDKNGVPTRATLVAFDDFALGKPYIQTIELRFYANDEALRTAYRSREVDAISGIAADEVSGILTDEAHIVPFYLPRVFAVFFNQNQEPAFTYSEVRSALDGSLDKGSITRTVLETYGNGINGLIPPGSFGYASTTLPLITADSRIAGAKVLLEQNGWKMVAGVFQKPVAGKDKKSGTSVQLAFSISTADTPELKHTAELIRDTWNKLGARVEVKIYEVGDLNQNVIRPRNFDSLFFGEIVGRNPDPYYFWHSSQRKDPGLNIAQYANPAVDKLAEEIRASKNDSERSAKLHTLADIIKRDSPASFIYAPQYIYVINNRVYGVKRASLTSPDERFSNIHTWYIDTERVWKIFKN